MLVCSSGMGCESAGKCYAEHMGTPRKCPFKNTITLRRTIASNLTFYRHYEYEVIRRDAAYGVLIEDEIGNRIWVHESFVNAAR